MIDLVNPYSQPGRLWGCFSINLRHAEKSQLQKASNHVCDLKGRFVTVCSIPRQV